MSPCYPKCIILVSFIVMATSIEVRLTNLKCINLDPSFLKFEKCELKVLKRGVIGMNAIAKLYQLPVTNVTVNIAMHKKANGYRPFLYNITVDFCQFLIRRSKYPFIKMVLDSFLKDSNINHSCPFDHDIIVRNWVLKTEAFKLFPIPSGDYAVMIKAGAYNDWKADVKAYFYLKE